MTEFDKTINLLLALYPLETILEMLNMTDEQVLLILFEEGHCSPSDIFSLENTDVEELDGDD